jgi:hypothetical protein
MSNGIFPARTFPSAKEEAISEYSAVAINQVACLRCSAYYIANLR